MNAHLSPDTIADYFSDTLSLDDRVLVAEHVADCDACALAAQGAFAASTVLDHWTARAHGQAATQALLVEALVAARARATVAAVRERLAAWAEQWAGQTEAALRIVLEAPGQAARIIAEESASFGRPGAGWQLAAAAPVPTRGASGRAARRGPPQPIVVTAGGPDGPTARVAVSGDRGEVVVRLDDVPRGEEPPLVLLVPTGPRPAEVERRRAAPGQAAERAESVAGLAASPLGAPSPPPEPSRPGTLCEPVLGTPQPSPDDDAWIARFEGLGPGDYLIVFEPRP